MASAGRPRGFGSDSSTGSGQAEHGDRLNFIYNLKEVEIRP